MRQLFFNQYEKQGSTDQNNAQLAMMQSVLDDFLYPYFGLPSGGVLGTSFTPSYVDATHISLAAGTGFFYDSSQTGWNPKFRMIAAQAAISCTITAAHATLNRIDKICLAPNFTYDATLDASRYIKTGGVGPITLTTVHKKYWDTYTLQVVAGTASASPAVPATPAGYIPIAQVLVTAAVGVSGSGSVTDIRTALNFLANNANHTVATGTTVQSQLDTFENGEIKMTAFNPATASPYTMSTTSLTGDKGKTFLVNSANGASQFNLPAPVANFWFKIKDVGGALQYNNLTMHRNGSEKFRGLATDYVFRASYGEWTIASDGTDWFVI